MRIIYEKYWDKRRGKNTPLLLYNRDQRVGNLFRESGN